MIQVGANNTYGHPTDEALDRLLASGARIFRTDLDGTVYMTSDGRTVIPPAGIPQVGHATFLPLIIRQEPPPPTPPPTLPPPSPTPTHTPIPVEPTPTHTPIPVEPTPTFTPIPQPDPMPGVNVVCYQIANAQICASVSNGTPAQNSNVTVYGRLLIDGVG